MSKFTIPFKSANGLKQNQLTYELYDHELASLWKKIVEMSVKQFNASYENQSQLYGKYFYDKDEVSLRIQHAVLLLKEAFAEEFEDVLFLPIRKTYFSTTQENLNLAHTFFERAHDRLVKDKKLNSYFKDLSDLNHNIHRLENVLEGPEGFSVSSLLNGGMKGSIDPSLNKFFVPNPQWGEMCLGYCHVGEGYFECFLNDYPVAPTPQTNIAGDFVLNFRHPNQTDMDALQSWLSRLLKKEVNIQDYPVGMVPIAKIVDEHSESSIIQFFKDYPQTGSKITFI